MTAGLMMSVTRQRDQLERRKGAAILDRGVGGDGSLVWCSAVKWWRRYSARQTLKARLDMPLRSLLFPHLASVSLQLLLRFFSSKDLDRILSQPCVSFPQLGLPSLLCLPCTARTAGMVTCSRLAPAVDGNEPRRAPTAIKMSIRPYSAFTNAFDALRLHPCITDNPRVWLVVPQLSRSYTSREKGPVSPTTGREPC